MTECHSLPYQSAISDGFSSGFSLSRQTNGQKFDCGRKNFSDVKISGIKFSATLHLIPDKFGEKISETLLKRPTT